MSPTPEVFSHLNLYAVLDSLPSGVSLANTEGRIVFSNEAADRILGIAADAEAPPEDWAERYGTFLLDGRTPFPTEDYPLVRALRGERADDVEMLVRNAENPDGVLISASGQQLFDADGEPIGAAVVFRDITKVRRMQNSLEDTVSELTRAHRLKDELAAFIVHDFKNPLTTIVSTVDLALGGGPLDTQLQEDLQHIKDAALRLNRQVLDLLDIQMAEDGSLELKLSTVSLSALLADVQTAVGRRVAAQAARIEIGNVQQLEIEADRPLLFRVLMNLVDNCLKYGPTEGQITLDAQANAHETILLTVRDEGPGVREDLRDRIFDKYAQVEREEGHRVEDSRGLGLRFCRVVTEAHGGRIWVEDAEPRGARFCLELPDRRGGAST